MTRLVESWCRFAAIAVAACLLGIAVPAAAQTSAPTSVNPTASSVKEEQLLKQLQSVQGRITIPDRRANVLIQPAGHDWRAFRDQTLPLVGAISIVGMIVLLILFLVIRGRVRVDSGLSGETVERFSPVERFAHWMTATSFIVLGLTGLNVTFGRQYVLPILGPDTFTFVSQWAKYLHNYMSFAFLLGIVLLFVRWVVFNLPSPRDIRWIAEGGGIFGKKHPPAARFNAGQKIVFWVTILGGLALAITGYMLMFPFYTLPSVVPSGLAAYNTSIDGIQLALVIHGLVGVVMIAVILAHIYIGTIGMQGAFWSMGNGQVDVNWARQHHSVWAEDVTGKQGSGRAMPAE